MTLEHKKNSGFWLFPEQNITREQVKQGTGADTGRKQELQWVNS